MDPDEPKGMSETNAWKVARSGVLGIWLEWRKCQRIAIDFKVFFLGIES